jgi:hypothetical protein
MDPLDTGTHSFILRIWLESPEDEGERARWRGHITHVATGRRQYVEHTNQIVDFIEPYLVSMGVKTATGQRISERVRRWVKRKI